MKLHKNRLQNKTRSINNSSSKRGSVLYLTFMMLNVLLLVSAGLTIILVNQLKMVRDIGNSTIAFYAADTGIERSLIQRSSPANIEPTVLSNGAVYEVVVKTDVDPGCDSTYCIVSIGTFKDTRRAIQISY